MSAPTTADAAADERWAAAHSLAEGVVDPGMPRRRRRVLVWITALAVGGLVLGTVLGVVVGFDQTSSTSQVEIFPVPLLIGITVQVLGILIGIIGFIWAKRTGRYITRWKYVISPLNRSERRWVLKQVRGRIEPDAKILPILVALARQLRAGMLGVAPLYVAIVLMSLGTATWAFESFPPIIMWVLVGSAAAMVVGGIFMARDYRLAGRFIARFGDDLSGPYA